MAFRIFNQRTTWNHSTSTPHKAKYNDGHFSYLLVSDISGSERLDFFSVLYFLLSCQYDYTASSEFPLRIGQVPWAE